MILDPVSWLIRFRSTRASVTDWEGTLETLVAVIGGTCCVYGILRASAATTQNYRNGKE